MNYSDLYYKKKYVDKSVDPRSAQELLADGARAGDPVCQYLTINSTYPKEERAAKRRELLCALRDIAHEDRQAAYEVAMSLYKQAHDACQGEEFMHYLMLAADQGHLHALSFAATEYSRGLLVRRDLAKHDALRLRAAELGDPFMQFFEGYYWERGTRREVDLQKAIAWYEKAAARGFHCAMEALGRLCMAENPARAKGYFEKSIGPFCRNGDYYLGKMCEERGDLAAAIEHYTRCLGSWSANPPFEHKSIATPDITAKAAFELGEFYRLGKSVQADMMRAVHYYSIAAYYGSEEAVEQLAAHQRTLKEPESSYLRVALLAWHKTKALSGDIEFYRKKLYGY